MAYYVIMKNISEVVEHRQQILFFLLLVVCFQRYCKYSINRLTAKDTFLLLRNASPILRYAGTLSSLARILYGIRFKISCGKTLMPSPLSTIAIIA